MCCLRSRCGHNSSGPLCDFFCLAVLKRIDTPEKSNRLRLPLQAAFPKDRPTRRPARGSISLLDQSVLIYLVKRPGRTPSRWLFDLRILKLQILRVIRRSVLRSLQP